MDIFHQLFNKTAAHSSVTLAHTPDGADAFYLAEIYKKCPTSLLYVARDDAKLQEFQTCFSFYAPDIPLFILPAWDTTPYDRISPHPSVITKRTNCLTNLTEIAYLQHKPVVLGLSLSSFLQKIPLSEHFTGRTMLLKEAEDIPFSPLQEFLIKEGFRRTETVHEPGEFAIRGGLIDIFPPALNSPVRLDFFGDTLQKIRSFDPLTQKSSKETLSSLILSPTHEIRLDADSIRHFRTQYRSLFGAEATEDPLYINLSEGRLFDGYEQWLPLFFEKLDGPWHYLKDPWIVFSFQTEESLQVHIDQIQDHYKARVENLAAYQKNRKKAFSSPFSQEVYRPIPPSSFFWDKDTLFQHLKPYKKLHLTPFSSSDAPSTIDMQGKKGEDWTPLRTQIKAGALPPTTLFDTVVETFKKDKVSTIPTILGGYSPSSLQRLIHIFSDHHGPFFQEIETFPKKHKPDELYTALLPLVHGFDLPFLKIHTEHDILGERLIRSTKKKKSADTLLEELGTFKPGDLLVHLQHGVGKYEGLVTLDVNGSQHDCLTLIYANEDKLFVPVENMEVLSRFGSEDAAIPLDRLGSTAWQARKARVKKRLKEVAEKLIAIAAQRILVEATPFSCPDNTYEEFAATFPYTETEDQLRAIEDALSDLKESKPMDRLICGDVGFGKTEVALRAAFVVAKTGKQVALLAPTTLLVRQHYQTFLERFKDFGLRVVSLSRLVSPKEAALLKKEIANGTASIILATHALFSKSLVFKDLGLLIIDEEQHFGVTQKDKLKDLYPYVHILTLTATPIPRTLQLALSGVRDLSLVTTPPLDRLAVHTFVLPYDRLVIREALMREYYRGGQSFYVTPRIEDLPPLKAELQDLVPDLKIGIAHGQLTGPQLEAVMTNFYDKKYDVLLSTNIVESGLDIPSANTLIVHKADRFGLAQLYQLRGRVGRSKVRGYAYFTTPPGKILSENAMKRLRVLETLDTLGVGFSVASHDMDIRGAGNLVGEEQSGHIKEVGIELYQHMLKEAIEALKSQNTSSPTEEESSPVQIVWEGSVLIPHDYIADLSLRLSLYRRLSHLTSKEDIDAFADELIDRFGPYPEEVKNLLTIVHLKRLAEKAGIDKIETGPKGTLFSFAHNTFKNPEGLIKLMTESKGLLRLRPDQKLILFKPSTSPTEKLKNIETLLYTLISLAEEI